VRQSRKLLLIGRDALMLAATDTDSEQLNPIFDLSRSLGKVADTRGHKRSALVAANTAIVDMRELTWPVLDSVTPKTLRDRCQGNLNTDFFAGRSLELDEVVFHEARKKFRQVVHMAILACSENPNQQLSYLVGIGKEINMRYGSFHNKLVRKQADQAAA
jgi:hypothetical protein